MTNIQQTKKTVAETVVETPFESNKQTRRRHTCIGNYKTFFPTRKWCVVSYAATFGHQKQIKVICASRWECVAKMFALNTNRLYK
jgi:hypothetical protein